ncbi:TadE family type IV pilus minor pilin [Nesterenkonia ebinurensis]|uniref:TadE family type IV pilus minor pilin n=1 Tax=Nesterenkonia ebinurensis TaxID=2608252 RepID=UPI00168AED2E|nr:TadE family type IV pilus minor pilin [Nesterenkonia ebinurensis]
MTEERERNDDEASPPPPFVAERGSVTAEFALALPGVVLVLLLVISLAMTGASRVALEDAARAAARESARGQSAAVAEQTARDTAGGDITVTISAEGAYTSVVVTQPVQLIGLIELNAEISAEAHARTEHLEGSGGVP